MTDVRWSTLGTEPCLRLQGVGPDVAVRVRAPAAVPLDGLPPMAARVVRDGDDTCVVARFGYMEGTAYTVEVDGLPFATLVRPPERRPSTTEVVSIRPTAAVVPRNLLRLYVWFSAPMSEGFAAQHVRLLDDDGESLAGALLPLECELWDPDRRRLTVLLDPARIKRGLAPHRRLGYPLRAGSSFRLVVDAQFPDRRGAPLLTAAERRYLVGSDERRRVAPGRWDLRAPAAGTHDALRVAFDRPIDHGLLLRCLTVLAPDGSVVDGAAEPGPEERSWRFEPLAPWAAGPHRLVAEPVLEDVAGNSVTRVFDRDLRRVDDGTVLAPAAAVFTPVQGRSVDA